MMKLKRPVAALLAAVLLLGLLSGCHRENGVSFRVAMGSVPATLDPALAATDEEKTVVSHLFENLMKLQSDGSGGTTAVNGVARSYQCDTTAEGQETYTFKLRSSAAWSDGTKVTAQDFVYAWKRLVDPLTGSKNARILDMVAGYSAARTGEDALQVSAPDDETFVVALSGRCPYFIDSVCTAAATMPVQSAAATQENWSMSPDTLVTNGPYTVASWENDTMLLQQTDGYHDARRLGPMSISFRFTADAKTANSLFEKGDADFVLGLTDEAVAKKIDSWMPDYYPETSVVLLNQLSDLTSNENVRRAMGLVIDRNAKGQQTVHFMNLVDEADLLALMEEDAADAYTAEKEAAAQAEQDKLKAEEEAKKAAEEEAASGTEQPKENKVTKIASGFLGVVVLIALAAGGGFYVFAKQKQKKQAEKEALDPDAGYTEDKGDFEIPTEDEPEDTGEEDTEPI